MRLRARAAAAVALRARCTRCTFCAVLGRWPMPCCTFRRAFSAGRTPRTAHARRSWRRRGAALSPRLHPLGAFQLRSNRTLTRALAACCSRCSRCFRLAPGRAKLTHHTQARMSSQSIYVSLRCARRGLAAAWAHGARGRGQNRWCTRRLSTPRQPHAPLNSRLAASCRWLASWAPAWPSAAAWVRELAVHARPSRAELRNCGGTTSYARVTRRPPAHA